MEIHFELLPVRLTFCCNYPFMILILIIIISYIYIILCCCLLTYNVMYALIYLPFLFVFYLCFLADYVEKTCLVKCTLELKFEDFFILVLGSVE